MTATAILRAVATAAAAAAAAAVAVVGIVAAPRKVSAGGAVFATATTRPMVAAAIQVPFLMIPAATFRSF